MKSYIPNNINFRIVSSTALAKFKQDQAYDFNELNKHRDEISAPAREVVLLEYDHWFRWVNRLEKVFLLMNEDEKTDVLEQKISDMLRNEMDEISEVMSIYTEFFNEDLTSFVNFVHRFSFDALLAAINTTLKENNMMSAYSRIVFFISIYLQQIMFALEEIEFLIKKTSDVGQLNYSGWCKETCGYSGICPLAERSSYYKRKFGINKFIIINRLVEQSRCVDSKCEERIKQYGIEIVEYIDQPEK